MKFIVLVLLLPIWSGVASTNVAQASSLLYRGFPTRMPHELACKVGSKQNGGTMKTASQWKTLTRDQRRAWNAWAKDNPVLLDDGTVRRVSGRKAMTIVLRNRAIAGEAANPTTVPAAVAWLNNAFSLQDAGPYTDNAGYIGFRAEQNIPDGTKWFVWATPPVAGDETNPHRLLRFVKCYAPGEVPQEDLSPDFGPDYLPVWGSWDGPGLNGLWPTDHFIWFRVHQYANGQLSPGLMMKGLIQVDI
jgi:hypothetical protein